MRWLFSALAVLSALSSTSVLAEPPRVLTTIKPLQSLAAGIMDGIAQPELLLKAMASAHTYALRPSDVQALRKADVVIWVGPHYEAFMAKAVRSLPAGTTVIEANKIEGLLLLKTREGGLWDEHADEDSGHAQANPPAEKHRGSGAQSHAGDHSGHDHGALDMHLWLEPANAKRIGVAIAQALGRIDPANAARYAANAQALAARLDTLDQDIADKLAPVKNKPFIVFHDAYQYLEKRYGLAAAGSITVTPDRTPGPRRLSELRQTVRDRHAVCVFSEPQFTSPLVGTVLEGTEARTGVLDPLGLAMSDGPDGYFEMMQGLTDNLRACLLPAP